MINVNELRFGNWVNFHDDDTYFEVTEITRSGLGVRNETEDTSIKDKLFCPCWYDKILWPGPCNTKNLTSLHHLQNIYLSLTGEELAIKL